MRAEQAHLAITQQGQALLVRSLEDPSVLDALPRRRVIMLAIADRRLPINDAFDEVRRVIGTRITPQELSKDVLALRSAGLVATPIEYINISATPADAPVRRVNHHIEFMWATPEARIWLADQMAGTPTKKQVALRATVLLSLIHGQYPSKAAFIPTFEMMKHQWPPTSLKHHSYRTESYNAEMYISDLLVLNNLSMIVLERADASIQ